MLSVFRESWVYSLRNWNHRFQWFQIFCTLESLRDRETQAVLLFQKETRKPPNAKYDKRANSFSSSVSNNPPVSGLFNKVCKIWHYSTSGFGSLSNSISFALCCLAQLQWIQSLHLLWQYHAVKLSVNDRHLNMNISIFISVFVYSEFLATA